MKVLDVKSLNTDIDVTVKEIHNFQSNLTNVQEAVRGVVSLDDSFRGKGGDAIRSFFNEFHQPFLLYMANFLDHFNETLVQVKQAVNSFESSADGFVRQDFLENDVNHGLDRVKQVTIDLTEGANDAIQSVQDIVSLPKLDPNELLHNVQRGKDKARDTIEQMHALDASQTSALESVQQELTTMKNYVDEMQGMFSGNVSIRDVDLNILRDSKAYDKLMEKVNPLYSLKSKFDQMLSYAAPYLLMISPAFLFPITYGDHKIDYTNIPKKDLDYKLKNGEFKNLGITPTTDEEVAAIKKYLQNYKSDGPDKKWFFQENKKAAITPPPSDENNYGIAGGTEKHGSVLEVTGGAGWYDNDWIGLDGDPERKGQIGGKSEASLIHGDMQLDTDFIDGNLGIDVLKGTAEARIGGTSLFGLNLPLPIAKLEGKAYELNARAEIDKELGFLSPEQKRAVGKFIPISAVETKGSAVNGRAYAGVDNASVGVALKGSLVEGEVSPIVGIPFTDWDLKITLGASAGSLGGEAKIGKETMLDLRALIGLKAGITFEKNGK